MVLRRSWLSVFSAAWAGVAVAFAFGTASSVNPDARGLFALVAVLTAGAAVMAARLLIAPARRRLAGLLLVVSAAAPTSFAWVVNVPAMLVGLFLLLDGQPLAWARVRTPRR